MFCTDVLAIIVSYSEITAVNTVSQVSADMRHGIRCIYKPSTKDIETIVSHKCGFLLKLFADQPRHMHAMLVRYAVMDARDSCNASLLYYIKKHLGLRPSLYPKLFKDLYNEPTSESLHRFVLEECDIGGLTTKLMETAIAYEMPAEYVTSLIKRDDFRPEFDGFAIIDKIAYAADYYRKRTHELVQHLVDILSVSNLSVFDKFEQLQRFFTVPSEYYKRVGINSRAVVLEALMTNPTFVLTDRRFSQIFRCFRPVNIVDYYDAFIGCPNICDSYKFIAAVACQRNDDMYKYMPAAEHLNEAIICISDTRNDKALEYLMALYTPMRIICMIADLTCDIDDRPSSCAPNNPKYIARIIDAINANPMIIERMIAAGASVAADNAIKLGAVYTHNDGGLRLCVALQAHNSCMGLPLALVTAPVDLDNPKVIAALTHAAVRSPTLMEQLGGNFKYRRVISAIDVGQLINNHGSVLEYIKVHVECGLDCGAIIDLIIETDRLSLASTIIACRDIPLAIHRYRLFRYLKLRGRHDRWSIKYRDDYKTALKYAEKRDADGADPIVIKTPAADDE